ncbi:Enoyl-[acyl-carrier-protein] reductase FabI [Rickettsiales endosymbiont of Paramecium tredecaurelia]|uniref:enoyl-ACP reductase FabI n=1 Tax=Candidatus Sarmatiella mevalonica TaxID=2770581 RepID=UPI0019236D51|nr:enoyl-ACP reductase [Candidatus Sarmatiella mevalonica]MBL3284296.1 Enoyl-[acyl-carrier-protein] reductase FabI [Candidatus Sarmatiella mevalonica]
MTQEPQNLLSGKKGLITGVANNMSLAYHIASFAKQQGADIAMTYQSEKLKSRVEPLAQELGADFIHECDASDASSLDGLFEEIERKWGKLDFLLHSMAFIDKNELKGRYVDTNLDNFLYSMNISCYSLVSMTRRAEKLMNSGGSILTLTYYGSQKVIPSYNAMGVAKAALETSVKYLSADVGKNGIRVNAISAGPIRTLAASGIGDFNSMLEMHQSTAPLKRLTTQRDVAGAAVYLFSDALSAGVTGEVHYVDCGYNIMGYAKEV